MVRTAFRTGVISPIACHRRGSPCRSDGASSLAAGSAVPFTRRSLPQLPSLAIYPHCYLRVCDFWRIIRFDYFSMWKLFSFD
jgi:hypothetical protein